MEKDSTRKLLPPVPSERKRGRWRQTHRQTDRESKRSKIVMARTERRQRLIAVRLRPDNFVIIAEDIYF